MTKFLELAAHYSRARRGKSEVVNLMREHGYHVKTLPVGIQGRNADIAVIDDAVRYGKGVMRTSVLGMTRVPLVDFMTFADTEYTFREREGWRAISPKRARKLRRRGEHVVWLPEYTSNAWIPPHLREHGAT